MEKLFLYIFYEVIKMSALSRSALHKQTAKIVTPLIIHLN